MTLSGLLAPEGPLEQVEFAWEALTVVEMETKYAGYIERDRERAAALRKRDDQQLPGDLPYQLFGSLSHEARQKLGRIKPRTMGQAARIPGISPADLQNLLVELRKHAAVRE